MSSYQHIRYEKERGRARIVLDRPEKHNAISGLMHDELHEALWRSDDDPEIHAIVLKGAGPSFCSGFDLSGYQAEGQSVRQYRRSMRDTIDDDIWHIEQGQRMDLAIFDVHKPVIAQVHGHCLAGGTVLAFFCDLVICAEDCRFAFPPSRDLGATPSMMWLAHAGPQWAKRLLLTGDSISGADAARIGLALKAVPAELLEEEVEQLLDRLALIDHHLLAANKRIVNLGLELMGTRTLQRLAAENDARAHLAPGTAEYFRRARELGIKGGFKERDAQFGDGYARVDRPERREGRGR